MKFPRRQFLQMSVGAAALSAIARLARAQAYPSHPVKLIVGFPAGGPADLMARLIGQLLSEKLGQQFIVENRVGAGSNIAAEALIRASSDGYTLLLATISNASNAALFNNLNFDFVRDTAPVAGIQRSPAALVVNPSFLAKTMSEFITYTKANPGKVTYASGGIGSVSHLYGELFRSLSGVDLLHIPYRGAGPALIDVLSGHVPVIFESMVTATPHIKAERLRPLAVTTAARLEAFPNVPTIGEFVPGYDASAWTGITAPRDTPPAIVETINRAVNSSLTDPRMATRLAELSAVPLPTTPAEFGKFVADETEKWGKVIRAAGIKAE